MLLCSLISEWKPGSSGFNRQYAQSVQNSWQFWNLPTWRSVLSEQSVFIDGCRCCCRPTWRRKTDAPVNVAESVARAQQLRKPFCPPPLSPIPKRIIQIYLVCERVSGEVRRKASSQPFGDPNSRVPRRARGPDASPQIPCCVAQLGSRPACGQLRYTSPPHDAKLADCSRPQPEGQHGDRQAAGRHQKGGTWNAPLRAAPQGQVTAGGELASCGLASQHMHFI